MTYRFNDALTRAVEVGTFAKHEEEFVLLDKQIKPFINQLKELEKRASSLLLAAAKIKAQANDPDAVATLLAEATQLQKDQAALEKKIDGRKEASEICILRDVYGRLRFAINLEEKDYPKELKKKLEAALQELGKFATTGSILFRDGLSNPDKFFKHHPEWHQTAIPYSFENGKPSSFWLAKVMDRQIIGQDWLHEDKPSKEPRPYRIVFYGLKGGVGRSTALAMTALGLAKEGKRVLLLDFDLESPGLASMLLPRNHSAKFGLVDWFVEDALEQVDEQFLEAMIVTSPLYNAKDEGINGQERPPGIFVAPAMASNETDYIAKLARVYADVPAKTSGEMAQTFATRMRDLVARLERYIAADVVLIDSRAGFHDVAAIAITSQADNALLFGTNAQQTWDGYEQLFLHWAQRPKIGKLMRQRVAMVQALSPATEVEQGITSYRQNSFETFLKTLYDQRQEDEEAEEEEDSAIAEPQTALFQPQIYDETAPHFPIRIGWSALFQEYAPLKRELDGGVKYDDVVTIFGNLQKWVLNKLTEHKAMQDAAKKAMHGKGKKKAKQGANHAG